MTRYRYLPAILLSVVPLAYLGAQGAPPVATPRRTAQAPPAARAAPMMSVVDPALFKGMKYRLVGPSRGGRVTTVTSRACRSTLVITDTSTL